MGEQPPTILCSVCGLATEVGEIVGLTFEQLGKVISRAELCPECVGFLSWVTEEDSVEVELDDDSPAFERWEAVGGCSLRGMPCVDIRPCPGHTRGLLN
jgi:hypothetical protein